MTDRPTAEDWARGIAEFKKLQDDLNALVERYCPKPPIDMILICPRCHTQHVDAPSKGWTNPPHRSHLCLNCGWIWRPADVPTNGVEKIKTIGEKDSFIQELPDWNVVGPGTPLGVMLETHRRGEEGINHCYARMICIDGTVEWCEAGGDGRTTVTHTTFAAPTHWRFIKRDED